MTTDRTAALERRVTMLERRNDILSGAVEELTTLVLIQAELIGANKIYADGAKEPGQAIALGASEVTSGYIRGIIERLAAHRRPLVRDARTRGRNFIRRRIGDAHQTILRDRPADPA